MFISDTSTVIRYTNIFINRSLIKIDISPREHYILMYLFSKKNINQEDISQYFAIDKGSISKTINSLVKKDYVIKSENPKKRRENIIALTKKGKKTFQKHKDLLDEWHKTLLQNIDKEEFSIVQKILNQMAKNAKNYIEQL